jgi:hypothetical protein
MKQADLRDMLPLNTWTPTPSTSSAMKTPENTKNTTTTKKKRERETQMTLNQQMYIFECNTPLISSSVLVQKQ